MTTHGCSWGGSMAPELAEGGVAMQGQRDGMKAP